MVIDRPNNPSLLPVNPDHNPYRTTLQDTLRKQGLQVIVIPDGIEHLISQNILVVAGSLKATYPASPEVISHFLILILRFVGSRATEALLASSVT